MIPDNALSGARSDNGAPDPSGPTNGPVSSAVPSATLKG